MEKHLPIQWDERDAKVFGEGEMKDRAVYISLNNLFRTPASKLPQPIKEETRKAYLELIQNKKRHPFEHYDEYKIRQAVAKTITKRLVGGKMLHVSHMHHDGKKIPMAGTYVKNSKHVITAETEE